MRTLLLSILLVAAVSLEIPAMAQKSRPDSRSKGIAGITVKEFKREDCGQVAKNRLKPAAERFYWDTLCNKVTLSVVTVSVADAQIQQKINRAVEETYFLLGGFDGPVRSVEELLNQVKGEDGFELSVEGSAMINQNDILGVSIVSEHYYYGAAHPLGFDTLINFDLTTGQAIRLEELLVPGYENRLNQLAEKYIYDTYGRDGWFFEPGGLRVNRNFSIQPEGLMFLFNSYEIGPYSAGRPAVVIPYSQITDLIIKGSPLGRLQGKP